MLLSFLTRAYRSIVELGCWVLAILLSIGMAIGFYEFFYEWYAAVGGFIVGFLIGLWFEINFVVPLTILFEINKKLDILCDNTDNLSYLSEINSNGTNNKIKKEQKSYIDILKEKEEEEKKRKEKKEQKKIYAVFGCVRIVEKKILTHKILVNLVVNIDRGVFIMKNLKKIFFCLIMFNLVFVLMSCGNPLKKAKTGWFYYSDGSCSEVYNPSKSVLGVIFSDAYIDDEEKATKYVLKNGWLLLEKATWNIGSTYAKETLVGDEVKTWYIPSQEESFSIKCYKSKLNISLQTLRDNNVKDSTTINGAIWTSDAHNSNQGIFVDYDVDGWSDALYITNKNNDLCLWPIMKIYEPKN